VGWTGYLRGSLSRLSGATITFATPTRPLDGLARVEHYAALRFCIVHYAADLQSDQ